MPQTSFSKLKKHSPTTLYMLYPMAQSVALIFVEKVKKKALQGHSPLSSSHHPSSIVQKQNHFGAQISCHINY
jgi:hypothetical protein